ncbi:phosphoethanolamine transferase CptA [Betaproteobacteria bacterium]|nr:phosphoethanolamine transferase CptA [Betaproteobacteria bacterium]GHT98397.1 phosphoethanolamine transferase CptA [Betaproteobacteria bacterium]GHU23093.1 phosphoethanolamine transferase CptA [Betaproteobacteria bacterium]GHU28256.1 phosphoethanolamine transferase CptA [Betaproteobacteria bacterium]
MSSIDWFGLSWLYLFFWYFSGITQTLLIRTSRFTGLRSAFYMSLIWLAPVLLFPAATKAISAGIGVILWAASVVSLSYWAIYKTEFSQSVVFTIFESNPEESKEYLSQYVNLALLAGIAVYTAIACLLWNHLRPVYLPRHYAIGVSVAVLVLNFVEPYLDYFRGKVNFESGTSKLFRRMEPAAPWQLVVGYLQYRMQLGNVKKLLAKNSSLPPLENLVDANGDAPRTLVLVIGESTTSQRMSLYGYPRKTTPRLDALKEKGELSVFRDVIASRVYTVEMLQQALSFAHQEEPDRFLTEPNLMNLMKQAGYKIHWITNQQTMTHRNTLMTMFSQQADETRYLNQNRAQNASSPDFVVLDPFAEALADPAPKKFIVVHLLGTHSKYALRYPEAFDVFSGREHVPERLSDKQTAIFNSYDNAVLYNDFIVSRLIEIFSKNDPNGFLLYFSDHGEDVFNDPAHETLGRNESKPSVDMYAVPFALWMSPEWKKTHRSDFASMLDRPYSNARFIHTWSDLAGLRYDRFQPESSLVNTAFQKKKRWIGNPDIPKDLRDFDALFLENAN